MYIQDKELERYRKVEAVEVGVVGIASSLVTTTALSSQEGLGAGSRSRRSKSSQEPGYKGMNKYSERQKRERDGEMMLVMVVESKKG